MSRNVSPETRALAARFIERFGHAMIDVDQLDMFLSDEGILPDLDFDREEVKASGGSLTVNQQAAWNGFIAARQNGRALLNRGGKQLVNGDAFVIRTQKSGSTYEIRKLSSAAKDYAVTEMGEKIRTFTRGRLSEFSAVSNQLDYLVNNSMLEDLSAEVWEVHQMYKILDTQAKLMAKKVDAMTAQYSLAVQAATDQAKELIEAAGIEAPLMIEDNSNDENGDIENAA